VAPKFVEQVGPDAGQQMVARERRFGSERVNEYEAGLRTISHGDSHGAVQLDDRGWDEPDELRVQINDAGPVGLRWRAGPGVAGSDLSLQQVGAAGGVDFMSAFDCRESAVDEELVPVGAVLIEE
jgi:hypothetical protein